MPTSTSYKTMPPEQVALPRLLLKAEIKNVPGRIVGMILPGK